MWKAGREPIGQGPLLTGEDVVGACGPDCGPACGPSTEVRQARLCVSVAGAPGRERMDGARAAFSFWSRDVLGQLGPADTRWAFSA